MKTFDVKLYFDGAETSDRGYLTDREFDKIIKDWLKNEYGIVGLEPTAISV